MIRSMLLGGLLLISALMPAPLHANDARPVPDLTLTDARGEPARLADLKGHVVVIDFWASWCVPCRASFPALDALQREFAARGLVVVAVNVDEQRKNAEAFLAGRTPALRLMFDPKGAAAGAFAIKGMPSSFVADRRGDIRFTHMGYTEKTIAQYRDEVLQLIGEKP
jgi:thiol-disulfide isomerase/thioredoxin